MTGEFDPIWDDLFHGVALVAFVEQAILAKDWPNSEAVKRHAYRLYEETLAERAGDHPTDGALTKPP